MDEIQSKILNIYKSYKQICERHDLRYFAIGGTCIGAVRHNGFIPWDDDIDIAMPISDYKRFLEIAETELQHPLAVYSVQDSPQWTWNFVKIHDTSTTFVAKDYLGQADRYTGVSIDIMPVYGMPCGYFKQSAHVILNDYLQYMNRRHRLRYHNWKKSIDVLLSVVRFILYGKKRTDTMLFTHKIEKHMGKYPFANSDKVLFGWRDRLSSLKMPFAYKTVFEYSDFSKVTKVPFEDTSMYIPIGYDSYLTTEFGDYMTLPPESKRVKHQVAILDLNKSYKEYLIR